MQFIGRYSLVNNNIHMAFTNVIAVERKQWIHMLQRLRIT